MGPLLLVHGNGCGEKIEFDGAKGTDTDGTGEA